jgi:hypothetical protein
MRVPSLGGGPVGAAFREHDVPMCRQRIDAAEWGAHGGADLGSAAVWSDRACGAAALRMILLACGQPAPPLTELVKAGVASGAYAGKLGWLHAALADMATSLGVPAQAEAVESVDLPVRLDQALLVASVTAELPADGRRGGHLIVLRGYELGRDDPLILFRDPSRWGQSHDRVRLSRLAGSYSGRCITVKSPAPPVTAEAAS